MRFLVSWALSLQVGWSAAVAAEITPALTNGGHFEFRTPRPVTYLLDEQPASLLSVRATQKWAAARQVGASTNRPVQLGSRLVLRLQTGIDPAVVLRGSPLELARQITPDLFILQAENVWTGLDEARRIAELPGVVACYPLSRRKMPRQSRYAPAPRDTYFDQQWNLENRDPVTGQSLGADLNVRAAWPLTRGAGVIVAVGDDGVEVTHPDLTRALDGAPHFNFETREVNGLHGASFQEHGTSVAGLIAAEANNGRGISGVAPEAKMASWVIYTRGDFIVDDELLMEMFQYKSNIVAVQNHSWANASDAQYDIEPLQKIGISNAVHWGRGGLGVVMVRAAGNGRQDADNANDDGYNADPLSISVAAARLDGRAATYSNPGACVLVAGPSSDTDAGFPGVPSTDRLGRLGFNRGTYDTDLADYAIGDSAFTGTSAATPQIAGVAALILSVNPRLGYRDVQQILALSARHLDLADPDLRTNGAGLRVSHNLGFGIPDAGEATRLARTWTNRPALTKVSFTSTIYTNIPDDSLHVLLTGPGVPTSLATIAASPSAGPHADQPTASLPLVDLGLGTNEITQNLAGKVALIQRGGDPADPAAYFVSKINKAAAAGAAFAVIYNNRDSNQRILMGDTDFVPIPAVFINQTDGEGIASLIAGKTNILARLAPNPAVYTFAVNDTLLCEQVQLRLDTDHTRRSDLRVTLVSPQGTRSVLQQVNADRSPGPVEWTYMTTHHLLESSAGIWTVNILDEGVDGIGGVRSVTLTINGTRIKDTDHDGLDDDWEQRHFGSLARGPKDDPDGDGYNNAREQVMGSDPRVAEISFAADLSPLNDHLARLSWPSRPGTRYEVFSGSDVLQFGPGSQVAGGFPETEWIVPRTNLPVQFFRVRAVPVPIP